MLRKKYKIIKVVRFCLFGVKRGGRKNFYNVRGVGRSVGVFLCFKKRRKKKIANILIYYTKWIYKAFKCLVESESFFFVFIFFSTFLYFLPLPPFRLTLR